MSTTEPVDTLETTGAYPKYDEYEDSGTEWIGEIPSHWDSVKFAYMIRDSNAGEVIDKTHWGEGNELVYSCRRTPIQSSFSDFPDDRRATEEDLLVTRNGTPYVHLPREDAIYTNVVQRLRIAEDLNRRFGWYCLSQAAHTLQGVGDIIESFNLSTWRNLRISLPPLDEQRAIATFLDRETGRIDALIEKKEELIDLLEEKRTALISRVVTKGLDGDVEMQDSGVEWLGEIPAGWKPMKLKYGLKSIEQGWSPQCESRRAGEDEWGVLKAGCVNGYKFDPSEHKALPTDTEPRPEYRVGVRDVLMSRANTRELLGSAVTVEEHYPKLLLCDKLYRLQARPDIDPHFLVAQLNSHVSRYQMERDATGASSSMQNISQDTVRNLLFLKPPYREQRRISNRLREWNRQIDALLEKTSDGIKRLKEYRTALISAAVTGQIDVREEVATAPAE
ncbi:type I restriction enzyme S subunit [Salinibacter ruber]|uniref:restriction endonuclease subunit S n=1 Tax=Salinibacter ruber TaxID=146919 RepID=UPI00216A1ACF|nr:restriction endonuclease subunit S [Salinibacter ruber]MCS3632670.1 type I restriction enzyme S subunit [Salinibacter ruber]MCS4051301.1 type I restriction enzyme S subunit [Salinibacter ruber]